MTLDDLDRLAALERMASVGKWEAASAAVYRNSVPEITEWFVRREEDDVAIAADILNPDSSRPSQGNAELIAALRNAALELIAAARRAEEAESLLEKFSEHVVPDEDRDCYFCFEGREDVQIEGAQGYAGHRPGCLTGIARAFLASGRATEARP